MRIKDIEACAVWLMQSTKARFDRGEITYLTLDKIIEHIHEWAILAIAASIVDAKEPAR